MKDGEFLAFVENDNEVHPGWLEWLIHACDQEQAGVGRPMIFERKVFRTFPHFDQRLGRIETVEGDGGRRYRFTLRPEALWSNGDPVTADDFVRAWRRARCHRSVLPRRRVNRGQSGNAPRAGGPHFERDEDRRSVLGLPSGSRASVSGGGG